MIRSIAQSAVAAVVVIVAARGAEYIRASSPKLSPSVHSPTLLHSHPLLSGHVKTVVVVSVVVLIVVVVDDTVMVVDCGVPVLGVMVAVVVSVDVAVDVGVVLALVVAVLGLTQNCSVCSSSDNTKPAGQSSQYWLANLLSKFRITWFSPHVNVVYLRHVSSTWSASSWYVPTSQSTQVLSAVTDGTYFSPVLHVG